MDVIEESKLKDALNTKVYKAYAYIKHLHIKKVFEHGFYPLQGGFKQL